MWFERFDLCKKILFATLNDDEDDDDDGNVIGEVLSE